MAVVACARRLRRAARRSAARTLALAILTLLLGAGAVHSTVVPEPAAPAKVQIAEVEHHATVAEMTVAAPASPDNTVVAEITTEPGTEPITGHLVPFPGDAARTAAPTRAPPRLVAA
jgi:H+/gluconate symporter-like permease